MLFAPDIWLIIVKPSHTYIPHVLKAVKNAGWTLFILTYIVCVNLCVSHLLNAQKYERCSSCECKRCDIHERVTSADARQTRSGQNCSNCWACYIIIMFCVTDCEWTQNDALLSFFSYMSAWDMVQLHKTESSNHAPRWLVYLIYKGRAGKGGHLTFQWYLRRIFELF